MYKVSKNIVPDCIKSMLIMQHEIHNVSTRQTCTGMFHLPLCKAEKKRRSFNYIGPYLWNNVLLPLGITDKSLYMFKKSLRTNIISSL